MGRRPLVARFARQTAHLQVAGPSARRAVASGARGASGRTTGGDVAHRRGAAGRGRAELALPGGRGRMLRWASWSDGPRMRRWLPRIPFVRVGLQRLVEIQVGARGGCRTSRRCAAAGPRCRWRARPRRRRARTRALVQGQGADRGAGARDRAGAHRRRRASWAGRQRGAGQRSGSGGGDYAGWSLGGGWCCGIQLRGTTGFGGGAACGRAAAAAHAAAHKERCPLGTDRSLTSENSGGRDRV